MGPAGNRQIAEGGGAGGHVNIRRKGTCEHATLVCMLARMGHLWVHQAGLPVGPQGLTPVFSMPSTPTLPALSEACLCWAETNGGRLPWAGLMKAPETPAGVGPSPTSAGSRSSHLLLWRRWLSCPVEPPSPLELTLAFSLVSALAE